jgi:hypothetical protein
VRLPKPRLAVKISRLLFGSNMGTRQQRVASPMLSSSRSRPASRPIIAGAVGHRIASLSASNDCLSLGDRRLPTRAANGR